MKVEAKTTNRSTERHPKAIQSNHGPASYQIRAGLFIPLDFGGGWGVREGAQSAWIVIGLVRGLHFE